MRICEEVLGGYCQDPFGNFCHGWMPIKMREGAEDGTGFTLSAETVKNS